MSGRPPLWGLLPLVALLAGWQLFVGEGSSVSFPPPSEWIDDLRFGHRDTLADNLLVTVRTVAGGLLLATVLGAAAGIAIGVSRALRRATWVVLEFVRNLPAPAVIPISLLVFGPGETTKLFAVTFAAIWPVLLNASAAAARIDRTLLDSARTLRLSRREQLTKIVVPATVPAILVGIRVAAPIVVIVAVVTEMLAGTSGIGRDLIEAQRDFRAAAAFGLLFIVGVLGYLLNTALSVLEDRVLRRWPASSAA